MTKKQDTKRNQFRVYTAGNFGALTVEADTYELVQYTGTELSYIAFFLAGVEVAVFPERAVTAVVAAAHEVHTDAFNAFH